MANKWEPHFEKALDGLVNDMLREAQMQANKLGAHEREILKAHANAGVSIVSIFLIYMSGFDEIYAAGPLAKAVPREVTNWVVGQVSRSESTTRVAGMMAASLCSSLEDLVDDVATPKITPALIVKLRGPRSLALDDEAAKQQLLKAIKPSVKADGEKWLKALGDVLGVVVPAEVGGTLIGMISFRNKYIHDPTEAFKQVVTGEEVKSWTLATLALSHTLIFG